MTTTPKLVQTPKLWVGQIDNTNVVNTVVDIFALTTPNTNGAKVTGIWATNTDTNGYTEAIQISSTNATNYGFDIPANAGTDGVTPAYNILDRMNALPSFPGIMRDECGQPFLYLKNGVSTMTIRIRVAEAMSGGIISVFIVGAIF